MEQQCQCQLGEPQIKLKQTNITTQQQSLVHYFKNCGNCTSDTSTTPITRLCYLFHFACLPGPFLCSSRLDRILSELCASLLHESEFRLAAFSAYAHCYTPLIAAKTKVQKQCASQLLADTNLSKQIKQSKLHIKVIKYITGKHTTQCK